MSTIQAVAIAVLSSLAACHKAAVVAAEPCIFPARAKSTIAWGLPSTRDSSFAGRVVSVGRGDPVPEAYISLQPGRHVVKTDSAGFFRFTGVPRGRYWMQVVTGNVMGTADSVTYGEFGIEVLVALASFNPDLVECVRVAPYPPIRPF